MPVARADVNPGGTPKSWTPFLASQVKGWTEGSTDKTPATWPLSLRDLPATNPRFVTVYCWFCACARQVWDTPANNKTNDQSADTDRALHVLRICIRP